MKQIFMNALAHGPFDLTDMLRRIDYHHIRGNLTDGEREELMQLAREKASFSASVDVVRMLQEMDGRLRALEEASAPETEQAPAPYQPGGWYRAGDRVVYRGERYVCTAPENVVCVWSPDEYPDYWNPVTE